MPETDSFKSRRAPLRFSAVNLGLILGPAFIFHQGLLDEQFLQLQQLHDESSPNFVSEVVNIYFHESEKLARNLRELLMDRDFLDYNIMGIHLNQFMGSSSSIGANRVKIVGVLFELLLFNRSGCLRGLEVLEHKYCYLKNKLHELFPIEKQRMLAYGVRYPIVQNDKSSKNGNIKLIYEFWSTLENGVIFLFGEFLLNDFVGSGNLGMENDYVSSSLSSSIIGSVCSGIIAALCSGECGGKGSTDGCNMIIFLTASSMQEAGEKGN